MIASATLRFFSAGVRRRLPHGVGATLLVVGGLLLSPPTASASDGMASYYGKRFHGRRTASGQRFDQHAMTAAHRTLRFGTKVRVTNVRSGRSVIVTINDRGPFVRGRVIDVSRAAASRLGMIGSGVAPVRLEVLGRHEATNLRTSARDPNDSVRLYELF